MSPTPCKPERDFAQTCLSEHTRRTQHWSAVAPRAAWLQPSAGLHHTCRLALEVQCSPKEAQQRKRQHGCSFQKEASSPAQGPGYCPSQDVACRSVLASMGMQPLAEGSEGHQWATGQGHADTSQGLLGVNNNLGNVFAHGSAGVSAIMRPAGPSAALCRLPRADRAETT